MKALLIIALLLSLGSVALAKEREFFTTQSPAPIEKVDALITLARDPKAIVYRCTRQVLTDKATLRNQKREENK